MNDRRIKLVEINGEVCCEDCSTEDTPVVVSVFHRTVGSTPDVPLHLCVECKRVKWE